MVQKTYSIYSDNIDNGQFFIEAGKNHLAFWCRERDENKITAFEFFQCDNYTGSSFDKILDAARLHSRLLATTVEPPHFIMNTDEALGVPANLSGNDEHFISQNFELLFGPCATANFLSENVEQYLFASRIDIALQERVRSCFPNVKFHTQYACLLRSLISNTGDDKVYLFFYPNYFSLIAMKDGRLEFLKTKSYIAADDVLYFVLNVFRQYKISNSTEILTGGFIDEQSKLYQTLYQYLEGLRPAAVDEAVFATGEFKDYSLHYFLPYANYVL